MSDGDIIIKKIKKSGHAAHGGAWKVAYADFVTAMMAFFLLLWLLSSASEDQLQGISDYFMPTIGLKDGRGVGISGGLRESSKGTKRDDYSGEGMVYGSPFTGAVVKAPEDVPELEGEDIEKIAVVEEAIKEAMIESEELRDYQENIQVTQTPEGLKIEITDKGGRSMFKPNTAILEPHTKIVLQKITKIIRFIPNYISITGHTSSEPLKKGIKGDYSNWDLSLNRSNSTRKFLIKSGLDKEHIGKLVAKADNELLDPERPMAPMNRRISIVILRNAKLTNRGKINPDVMLSGDKRSLTDSHLQIRPVDLDKEQKKTEEEKQTIQRAIEHRNHNMDALKSNKLNNR